MRIQSSVRGLLTRALYPGFKLTPPCKVTAAESCEEIDSAAVNKNEVDHSERLMIELTRVASPKSKLLASDFDVKEMVRV